MVGHHAQSVEFETEFIQGFFEGVQKYLTAFKTGEFEFAIVAANGDVVAVSGLDFSGLAGHGGRMVAFLGKIPSANIPFGVYVPPGV